MKKKKTKKTKRSLSFYILILLILTPVLNIGWQVYKKPSELLRPFAKYFNKSPKQTWYSYYDEFKEHSEPYLTPEFLAALAQVESSGNPIAQTYWDLKLSTNIEKWYAPASSSVGLYQLTEPTFKQAQKICKKNNTYVLNQNEGIGPCYWNRFKTRLSASDSIELTANHLNYNIKRLVQKRDLKLNQQKAQALASVIHLCGPGVGERLVRNAFRLESLGSCGKHNPKYYHRKITRLAAYFKSL